MHNNCNSISFNKSKKFTYLMYIKVKNFKEIKSSHDILKIFKYFYISQTIFLKLSIKSEKS